MENNNENQETNKKPGIIFLDYDKISDTLMWLSRDYMLKFCVSLKYKNSRGDLVPFHSEYKSYSETADREYLSISLYQSVYFVINCNSNYNNSVLLRPNDVVVLTMLYNKTILSWYVGPHKVFGYDENHQLILTGKYPTDLQVPMSDNKYLGFLPITDTYENGDGKEGLRIFINSSENYIDLSIDRMFEFFYYICNTNMVEAAIGLMNYVKIPPYGQNLVEIQQRSTKAKPNFFNKL